MSLRVVFFGSPDFAVPSLHATQRHGEILKVITQPDRPAGRGKKLRPPAVKVAAQELGLEILQPESVKDPDFLAVLRDLSPDLAVVVAYGKIFPGDLLDLPKHGCINVHGSLLPRWRGAAPIQRALLSGDERTGVCIMQLEAGCDTGPVYGCASMPIAPEDTSGTLFEKLAVLGGELLGEFLRDFDQRPEAKVQAHDEATHAQKIDRSESPVDWSRPAAAISCQLRGLDPWPGATARLCLQSGEEATVLKLFAPQVVDAIADQEQPDSGRAEVAPGTIVALDDAIWVACGDRYLGIFEIQAPGKRKMPVKAFLSGVAIEVGDRFEV